MVAGGKTLRQTPTTACDQMCGGWWWLVVAGGGWCGAVHRMLEGAEENVECR